MLKSVLGAHEDGELHHVTTPSLYLRAGILDPAAYIALERLRLAESIYKHGWTDLQHLLDVEQRHLPTSWLAGLQGAVEWYNAVVLPADEIPTELPDLITFWRTSTTNWKRNLLKLARRHLHQERLYSNKPEHIIASSSGSLLMQELGLHLIHLQHRIVIYHMSAHVGERSQLVKDLRSISAKYTWHLLTGKTFPSRSNVPPMHALLLDHTTAPTTPGLHPEETWLQPVLQCTTDKWLFGYL